MENLHLHSILLHFAAYTPNLATTVSVQETPKSLQWKEKERNMTQDVLSIIFWTQIFFFIEWKILFYQPKSASNEKVFGLDFRISILYQ